MTNFDLSQQAVAVRSPRYLWRMSWEEADGCIEQSEEARALLPRSYDNNKRGLDKFELSEITSI
jgi:hypothetical protein